jgi:hypothetical protein
MKKIIFISISVVLLAASCNRKQAAVSTPATNVETNSASQINTQKADPPPPLHMVGQITWHPADFVNKKVRIIGYLIKAEKDYILFSDENYGPVTLHDLPVSGNGAGLIKAGKKYILEGIFLDSGLVASNKSPYHLELAVDPKQQ